MKRRKRPRARLTHFEIRRHGRLRLRIEIADDALAEAGDELGALVRQVAPSTYVPFDMEDTEEIVIAPEHPHDDVAYHEGLRSRLAELFGSLCDASLSDALEIAREECARRTDGVN